MKYEVEIKPQTAWAWSNMGLLRGIARTRAQAKEEVRRETGEHWLNSRKYMEVWKCIVYPQVVKKAKP